MTTMTAHWTPDHDTAQTFDSYREALKTERDLKPTVQALALDALKAGGTITQLSRLTGMTPEVFRRMARKHDIPVDSRYQERAEATRKRAIPTPADPHEATDAQAEPTTPEPTVDDMIREAARLPDWVDRRLSDLHVDTVIALDLRLVREHYAWHTEAIRGAAARWKPYKAVTKALAEGKLTEDDLTE